MKSDLIDELNTKSDGKSPEEILQIAQEAFKQNMILATSLGEEDQILTDMLAKTLPGAKVFTLDTGRLFAESYELLAKTQQRYDLDFKVYYPDTKALEEMVKEKGINLFYESIENRKQCCGVRKVEPLQRALKGNDAWITGLRRAQSVTRSSLNVFEWDKQNKLVKINPLAAWSLDRVKDYIAVNKIDINPLHEKGFVSIGCAPCTRAVKPGEDIRAGRWWWESPEQKECGLHNNPNRPQSK